MRVPDEVLGVDRHVPGLVDGLQLLLGLIDGRRQDRLGLLKLPLQGLDAGVLLFYFLL